MEHGKLFGLLLLLVAVGLVASPETGWTQTPVSVSLPDTSVITRDTLDVPVIVESSLTDLEIIAVDFTVSFNSEVLRALGVVTEGTLAQTSSIDTAIANTTVPGRISVGIASGGMLQSSGTLIFLRFEAIGEGGQTTPLIFEAFQFNEDGPAVQTTPGSVLVRPAPPVAVDDSVTTAEDTPVTIHVLANDYDLDGTLDPTTVTLVSVPQNGTAEVDSTTGAMTYTPDLHFFGMDTLSYTVRDNEGFLSDTAQVAIRVTSVNDPPVAAHDTASTIEDTPVTIDVLANDSDLDGTLDPTSVTVVKLPSRGTTAVNPTTGAITYTPNPAFFGTDSLAYTVEDDSGAVSNEATVEMTVNHGPIQAANSLLSADPTRVLADGITQSTIILTARDANNHQINLNNSHLDRIETFIVSGSGGTLGTPVISNSLYNRPLVANQPGLIQVGARFDGQALSRSVNVLFIPPRIDANKSVVEVDRVFVPADGQSTAQITVIPKNSEGNDLPPGKRVTIKTTHGTLIDTVREIVDPTFNVARYTQTIRAGTSGRAEISVEVLDPKLPPGVALASRPVVNFFSLEVDSDSTTVTARPDTIRGDGVTTAIIEVVPKNATGQLLGAGQQVVLATNAGTLLGSVEYLGHGVYRQLLQSVNLAGSTKIVNAKLLQEVTATVSAQVNQVTINTQATVAFVPNRAPVAHAGTDQTVNTGALVQLNGAGSSDPDGDPITFAWTQVAGPTVTLNNATTARPFFTPATAGAHIFQLLVNDGKLSSAPDSVTITATPPKPRIIPGSITVRGIDANAATIVWQTDIAASTRVRFGLAQDALTDSVGPDSVTLHEVRLTGLTQDTTYVFQVVSVANAQQVASTFRTFHTLKVIDSTPPRIIGVPSVEAIDTSSVTISWSTDEASNSEVEFGLDTSYGQTVQVGPNPGNPRFHAVRLTGLTPNTLYHYRVRSTDAAGNPSAFSADFTFRTAQRPDTTPPVITSGPRVDETEYTATVVWTTNELSDSQVEYGATIAYGWAVADTVTFTRDHRITLTNLTPGATYNFRVVSKDPAGNPGFSANETFTTPTLADTTDPVIVLGPHASPRDSVAIITWRTNEESDSRVYAWTALGNVPPQTDSRRVRDHVITLSQLTPGTPYFYRVRSSDASGNEVISDTLKFTTTTIQDTVAPLIVSGPLAQNPTSSSVLIRWRTDERSTSTAEYDTTRNLATLTQTNLEPVLDHRLLLTNLLPDKLYYYRVKSADAQGNTRTSAVDSFQTKAVPDTAPPEITAAPMVVSKTQTTATISWQTDELATTRVRYGTQKDSLILDFQAEGNSTQHFVALSGLQAGTRYFYRVFCRDVLGNGPTVFPTPDLAPLEFQTNAFADTLAPVIVEGPTALGVGQNRATVVWTTDEVSDGVVRYATHGDSLNLEAIQSASEPVRNHTVELRNLAASTEYFYRVRSTDPRGNGPTKSRLRRFKTLAVPDTSKPVITAGPAVGARSENTATIRWTTDKPSNSSVHYGTARDTLSETVSRLDNIREHLITLTGLEPSTQYFYQVSSVDELGNKVSSAITDFNTRAVRDTLAPTITRGPVVTGRTHSSVTIVWDTDEPSNSTVNYDTSTVYSLTASDAELVTRHALTLTNLIADKTYHYFVESTDPAGNRGRKQRPDGSIRDFAFTTPVAPDTTAPEIIRGPIVTAGASEARVTWSTDETGNSQVIYGLNQRNPDQRFENAALVQEHTAILTNLQSDTLYFFRALSTDPSGNTGQSQLLSFQTAAVVVDTVAPKFTLGPILGYVSSDRGVVFFTTDEPTSMDFFFKPNTETVFDVISVGERKIEHEVVLTNLLPNMAYDFLIRIQDAAGNPTTFPTASPGSKMTTARLRAMARSGALAKIVQVPGGLGSFTTNLQPDTQLPIILSGPTVTAKTANSITIEWITDEIADSQVDFGAGGNLTEQRIEAADVTNHVMTVTNLQSNTTYNFRVGSTDPSDNGVTLAPAAPLIGAATTGAEADVEPPVIDTTSIKVEVADVRAVVSWKTNEPSDTRVEFGAGGNLTDARSNAQAVSVHSMVLTNLTSDTEYTFRVGSRDLSGNGPSFSKKQTFHTLPAPDVTAPLVDSIRVTEITNVSAVIEWTTNELADSFVDFFITGIDTTVMGDATLTETHRLTLTNLVPSTTYEYIAGSTDVAGNGPTTNSGSFTTLANPDTVAPVAPTALTATPGSEAVFLAWTANSEDDLAGYNVYRVVDAATDSVELVASGVTDTTFLITGLANGVEQTYRITAFDQATPANESESSPSVVATPAAENVASMPEIRDPGDGAEVSLRPNLTIGNATPPSWAPALTYTFVVAEDSAFINIVASATGIPEGASGSGAAKGEAGPEGLTIWQIPDSTEVILADSTIYFWRVRANDGVFDGPWSLAARFVTNSQIPTAVELASFTALAHRGVVTVFWQTAGERDPAGFNLLRSPGREGSYQKLNGTLILPRQEGLYQYVDGTVKVNQSYFYRLEAVDRQGRVQDFGPLSVRVGPPRVYALSQNYPNPFNPETTIRFDLPRSGRVTLVIYNLLGQEVRRLLDRQSKEAGFYLTGWDGRNRYDRPVASGIYFYRLAVEVGGKRAFVKTRKMVLLR